MLERQFGDEFEVESGLFNRIGRGRICREHRPDVFFGYETQGNKVFPQPAAMMLLSFEGQIYLVFSNNPFRNETAAKPSHDDSSTKRYPFTPAKRQGGAGCKATVATRQPKE